MKWASDGIVCIGQIKEEMGNLFLSDGCIGHENYNVAERALKALPGRGLNESTKEEKEHVAVNDLPFEWPSWR